MSTKIGLTGSGTGMATVAKIVAAAGTVITMRRRASRAGIEAMCHAWLETVQARHNATPFAAVWLHATAILEVMNQPVRHLVGNHIDEEGLAILAEQNRVEAQSTATEMGLTGAFATDIQPHLGARQLGIHLAGESPGGIDPLYGAGIQCRPVEGSEFFGIRGWKHRGLHCDARMPLNAARVQRQTHFFGENDMQETPRPTPLLDDEELDRLDDFLDSDRVDADALDVIGAHGFLVALAVAPRDIPATTWVGELFHGEPEFIDDAERDEILSLLERLRNNAVEALEQGHLPELPFELELGGIAPEETPIGDWCAGFMEGVFLDEAAWFEGNEEDAATLLLPFMVLSGLFEDEPEMADLSRDATQAERLVQQLPELTLDLYLHYRVPPESPKPTPRKKKPAGRGGKRRR